MNANGEPVALPSSEIPEEETQITEEQAQQMENQLDAPAEEPQPTK